MGDDTMEGQSPASSLQDDVDETQWQSQGVGETMNDDESGTTPGDTAAKPTVPMQKRRRVTRACDECRRKKIKCDGKQPCTHCTVYSYECTYDQPSNRRRNPAPQYIEALEARLHKAESLLRVVMPNVDLDDPKVEARGIDQIVAISQRRSPSDVKVQPVTVSSDETADDAQLESMVQNTGSLDLDDSGNWDYHGGSSGYTFLRKLRKQMGTAFGDSRQLPIGQRIIKPSMMDTPKSTSGSPLETSMPNAQDLPPREVARALCRNALDDATALMRPLHQPTFYTRFERLYNTDPERYTNDDVKFLPLLYVVLAVGSMFSTPDDNRLDTEGYEKYIGQGFQYFNTGRQMLDITEIRDVTSLQTVCFMIIFLQSTAKLSTCYSLVGIAMRACLRLGLHRNVHGKFDFIEQQQRKRVFWLIAKMDSYVSAMLGLPQMLSDEDIDQELPAEVDDDKITAAGILPQPPNTFPLIAASNAHTRLTAILKKVVKYVYPIKGVRQSTSAADGMRYMVSHARIRELENDLQIWMDELPMELRPSDDAPHDLARVQQLLRISYAHLQMMMYRPFLHYVSSNCQSKGVDKRTFACAAACVSVARNIVHITSEMKRRRLLIGAYWFVMYTTYFGIVALVYFCLENPLTNTGREILKDAQEGRETLASLARRSLAADRCTQSLTGLFNDLPEKIQDRMKNATGTTKAKKRPPPKASNESPVVKTNRTSPNLPTSGEHPGAHIQRSSTFPTERVPTSTKQHSGQDPSPFRSPATWNMNDSDNLPTPESVQQPFADHQQPSPQSSTFDSQLGNPNLPDLKNVMFPSDNPFAYPNQPISTLEGGHLVSGPPNASTFYMADNAGQNNIEYGDMGGPVYDSFGPFGSSQPPTLRGLGNSTQFAEGNPGISINDMQRMDNNGFYNNPGGNGNSTGNDEFWAQIGGPRSSGMTPGVNLEDLFGSEQFNPMWENVATATNQHGGVGGGGGYGMP